MKSNNDDIIKWFELLIKQLQFYVDIKKGKDKLIYSFKVNSIKKALDVIKKVDFKIKSGEDLKDYANIGKGTIQRINEIIDTGVLSEVHEADISGKHLEYVDELMKIFGIGRNKAYELYTNHGITNINELKKAIKDKKITLPENIMKGIKYVDKIKNNIPRSEMDEIYSYLIYTGIKLDPNMDVRVCGSYRREKPSSNDIDVIIAHPDIITRDQSEKSHLMFDYIKLLRKSGFIIDSLTSDNVPTKYMGLCKLDKNKPLRRIDIRCMPQESYYTAILYFTGSDQFNRRMRNLAHTMGYETLNEYGLYDSQGNPAVITSEKDVFDKLNMEYLQPPERV